MVDQKSEKIMNTVKLSSELAHERRSKDNEYLLDSYWGISPGGY